jgi:hypothetical protein
MALSSSSLSALKIRGVRELSNAAIPFSALKQSQQVNIMMEGKAPEIEEGQEDVYYVETILDERKLKGKVQFLIKWLDYPE